MKICERIWWWIPRKEVEHQTSLKVPNGGTMSGALPDGREERGERREGEVGRGALTTNILFLAERMSRVKRSGAKLGLRALKPGL